MEKLICSSEVCTHQEIDRVQDTYDTRKAPDMDAVLRKRRGEYIAHIFSTTARNVCVYIHGQ